MTEQAQEQVSRPGQAEAPNGGPSDATAATPPPASAQAGISDEQLVAAPEYFGADRQIAPEYQRHYEYVAQVFAGRGVRSEIAAGGMDDLEELMDLEQVPDEQPRHGFDVSRYQHNFRGDEQRTLTAFLNKMHARGARQSEVAAFIDLYLDSRRSHEKRAAATAGRIDQPTSASAMSLEDIRHVMKTDRRRYFRDEAMQQRYRQLLAGGAT